MRYRILSVFSLVASFAIINIAVSQTSVTADISTNTSWNVAGSPYTITSSISVKNGATLTVEATVVVNIETNGTLTIADSAKLNAAKMTFSRAASGEAQIIFSGKSSGVVDSCSFTKVYVYCNGPSTPSVTNSQFTSVTYPLWLNDGATPVFTGNTITGATNQGIKIAGSVYRSWTIPNYGLPYYVDGNLTLHVNNSRLTIADGCTLNFLGSNVLYLYGTNTGDTLQANNVTLNRIGTGTPDVRFDGPGIGSITNCTFTGVSLGVENGSPSITGNTFTGQSRVVGIYVYGSGSPVVSNNTISGYTYPYSLNNGATINLSGNTITGNTYTGIALGGNVYRSWTIPNYGLPYYLDSNVCLRQSNCKLAVADGNTLNFLGSNVLYLYGTNTGDTLQANNVTFNRIGSGTPDVRFDGPGIGSITNCTFTGVSLGVENGSPSITGNTFTGQARVVAIYVYGSGSPVVSNNTISGYTYPYSLNNGATINLSGNTITGSTYTGIALGGNVYRSWTIPNYGLPYYLDSNVCLRESNCKLTIADGITLNFFGSNVLYTYGTETGDTLQANNITFNRIGTGTPDVRFDGPGIGSITNCTFTGVSLGVQNSSPSITGNTFTGQARVVAINVFGSGSPVVSGNTISGYTYPYWLNNGATINLSGNTITGSTYTGIALGGNVYCSWTIPNYGLPYYLDSNVCLRQSNCKLTVAEGITLNFFGSNVLYTYGTETGDTLQANNVAFTRIGPGTPDVRFDGPGIGSITNCTFTGVSLGVQNGSPSITGNTFTGQSRVVGIYVFGSGSPVVSNNTISGYTYPYSLNNGATINLSGNTITGNTYTAIALGGNVYCSWTIPNYGLPYYLDSNVCLRESNCKLTIADGITLNFFGSNVLYTYGTETGDTLQANNVTLNRIGTGSPAVQFDGSAIGIVKNSIFKGVQVRCNDATKDSLISNRFEGSIDCIVTNGSPTVGIVSTDFCVSTSNYGVKNLNTANVVVARNNYWGHSSGPQHTSNPTGLGVKVTDGVDFGSWSSVTGLKDVSARNDIPKQYQLEQNYPNPFNPATEIQYALPEQSNVRIAVFGILGAEIARLSDGPQEAGFKSVVWNGRTNIGVSVASGVYFYRIEAVSTVNPNNRFVSVRRMLLLK